MTRVVGGELYAALTTAEQHGVTVNLHDQGPMFPDLCARYVGASSNTGTLLGLATKEVSDELRLCGVHARVRGIILDGMRMDVLSTRGGPHAALATLMEWVDQDDAALDEDEG